MKKIFTVIVTLICLLSVVGCSASDVSFPSAIIAGGTAEVSPTPSGNAAKDDVIESAQIFTDIIEMVRISREGINSSFLVRGSGDNDPAMISEVYHNDKRAIFGGEGRLCLAEKDARNEWVYFLLECYYFGAGDYRFLANKEGSYVAISDYSGQILILNADTKKVSVIRLSKDIDMDYLKFLFWNSDVLYFCCMPSAALAYAYDADNYSLTSVQQSEIPEQSDEKPADYDYDVLFKDVFGVPNPLK